MTRVSDGGDGFRDLDDRDGDFARQLNRLDALVGPLRDGLRSFDTDTAAVRWQTMKLVLRAVLALLLLRLGRQKEDE